MYYALVSGLTLLMLTIAWRLNKIMKAKRFTRIAVKPKDVWLPFRNIHDPESRNSDYLIYRGSIEVLYYRVTAHPGRIWKDGD
jgi:hypothetical protein